MRSRFLAIWVATGASLAAASSTAPATGLPRNELGFGVRPGYEVTVAVETLPGARFMVFDDAGTLYISRPGRGDIIAFRDEDGDGAYEKRATFVEGRSSVHGLDFADGWVWFTTSGSIHKARPTTGEGAAEVVDVIPQGGLPRGGGHWWRSIAVTPDGFYTSIGDSGNITDQTATDRQKIWKFDLDGKNKRLWSSGIRNTEKLRLRPGTNELWGVDHGSDNFGAKLGEKTGRVQPVTDLNPPCEFNLYTEGGFYGHPFVVGTKLPRIEFQDRKDIIELADKTIPPEWNFGSHWAPNGFCFIDPTLNQKTGGMPKDHEGDAFVAFHGSWNSVQPVGYQVSRVLFDQLTGKPYGLLTIVDTLGPDGKEILARPVDCVQAPDGSVLFSCDHTGRVLRIRHVGER